MQFLVQTTCIAQRLASWATTPQGRLGRVTVLARGAGALVDDGALLWADQGTIGAIHLDIEATGIAQVLASGIAPPEWCFGGGTVDTDAITAHVGRDVGWSEWWRWDGDVV